MKKITVIGGAGFVGTYFCQRLAEDFIEFEILDIKKSQRFPKKSKYADVRDVDSLRQAITGDVVVNLAAVHRDDIVDKSEYYNVNVEGARNIVTVCCEKKIHSIIFTSSVAVYGDSNSSGGVAPVIAPSTEYGRTKYLAEEVFLRWHVATQGRLIIVRPAVIFGEGNRGNVFNLFQQIASGRFLMIGSGRNYKSMAYVENVSFFLRRCIEADVRLAVFNYVDTPDLDMNALVRHVRHVVTGRAYVGFRVPYFVGIFVGHLADFFAAILKKKFRISAVRVKKFCSQTRYLSSVDQLSGFEPPFSLREGLDRTLQHEFVKNCSDGEVFFTE